MRHIFIVNPAAGKNHAATDLIPAIRAACERQGCEYTIHITAAPGEATRLAAEASASGEPCRLYACGGDGTLWEVLAGIPVGSSTEFAPVPCGSGNDFVRMLGGPQPFLQLERLIAAPSVAVDGMECRCGDRPVRYALNVAATGMDAAVAYHMGRIKRRPLVSGSMAYDLALAKVFFGRLGCRLRVRMTTAAGMIERQGRFLFALCANGTHYGGGYCGAPQACPADGLLDFVLVDKMPRMRILQLLPHYKRGTHVGKAGIHTFRGTAMAVTSDRPIPATLDGECFLTDSWEIRLCPSAWRLVLPEGARFPRPQASLV